MTRTFRHPSGRVQRLAAADLLRGGVAVLLAMADGPADVVYSDPPWNPGNEKWWRRHAGEDPPRSYDAFLDAWCSVVAALAPRHVFVEQSVNPEHQGLLLRAVERTSGWRLPFRERWIVQYGHPKRPNALLHFGHPAIDTNPSELSGPELLRVVFTGIRLVSMDRPLVADPCTGLGTTSRVAHEFGADFVGTELNPKRMERTIDWLLKHGYREEAG